ncbi:MAG: DUF3341 domain-containing protein [Bacteroidota bacterium]|nr:DUF3341 domain-containing protein [Bacteroidota bacterium]
MIDKKLFLDKNKTVIFGIFENPDQFLSTVGKVHSKGLDIIDCYSPFPIHGIEKAMGLKRSLLPVGAFLAGLLGFIGAGTLQWYTMSYDWPIVIGNKPSFGVSYVPVWFEGTILFTAFGIAILFFIRNKMLHGKMPSERIDMRQTDDRMIVAIASDNPAIDKEELTNLLFDGGAVEVKERTNHGYEDFTDANITK